MHWVSGEREGGRVSASGQVSNAERTYFYGRVAERLSLILEIKGEEGKRAKLTHHFSIYYLSED